MRVAGLWGKAASSLRQRPKLQRPLPRPGPYLPSWDSPSFTHLVVAAALKSGSRSFRPIGLTRRLPMPYPSAAGRYRSSRRPIGTSVAVGWLTMQRSRPPNPALSIIVPTYQESANIPILFERLKAVLNGLPWEMIVVDDDSPDGTSSVAFALAAEDDRVFGACGASIGRG